VRPTARTSPGDPEQCPRILVRQADASRRVRVAGNNPRPVGEPRSSIDARGSSSDVAPSKMTRPWAVGLSAEIRDEVAAKAGPHGVHSPTGGVGGHLPESRTRTRRTQAHVSARAGQSGALFALGETRLCLEYLSRPAAFARLYPKLLEGYLLDALESLSGRAACADALGTFLRSSGQGTAPPIALPGARRGHPLRGRGGHRIRAAARGGAAPALGLQHKRHRDSDTRRSTEPTALKNPVGVLTVRTRPA
jgi:hypothetical protein